MKNIVMFWVATTTMALIFLTVIAVISFPFNWVFYLTMAGQMMLVVMAFRVLTDNYNTEKTFGDFYEDHPINE